MHYVYSGEYRCLVFLLWLCLSVSAQLFLLHIPLLLSTGVGAEIQKPLASVIVGGLLTATFLTLFVLPVLYPWFSKWQQI
ncbi:efflux RND transporter permease subunit [Gammaproteobacteria bacterium]|nr:efflux RND transporter permease subunit [Gammaproteobacteria bacterium]